jgi:hypothetical protein
LKIHHGWTLWFQSKRTTRLGANVSPIIGHLVIILQVPSQMWITMEENPKLILLCDLRNLGLLGASKAKPFANWHFFHWWHETSRMSTSRTLITNNIMVTPKACPHNTCHRPTKTMAKDGSIWPSTLGRLHGAQLHTWSFHV